MNNLTSFLSVAPPARRSENSDQASNRMTDQHAYLEFLSVLVDRPNREVLVEASAKVREQIQPA